MNVENDGKLSRPEQFEKIKTDSFIFFDTEGRRWSKFRLAVLVAGIVFILALTGFARTLFVPSQLRLSTAVKQLKSQLKALENREKPLKKHVTPPVWLNFSKFNNSRLKDFSGSTQEKSGFPVRQIKDPDSRAGKEIRLGFYENWDPDSIDSLRANADKLTHLSPDWMTLEDGRGRLRVNADKEIQDFIKARGIVLLPLLSNMAGSGNWVPDVVEGLISGPLSVQEQFAENLTVRLKELGAGGVILDFEDVDPSYRESMTVFLKNAAAALHAGGLELWLCVPMGRQLNIFDLDALAEHMDRFVAMMHDENAESDPPGPIASQEWFDGWLYTLVEEYGEPWQWVIALGSYGYDWTEGEKEAVPLRFQDVMSRAFRSSLEFCEFDGESLNPNFSYESSGVSHTVWFLDAVTFFNQLKRGRERHVGGVAVSRLGMEDPAVWQVLDMDLDRPSDRIDFHGLETIRPDNAVANIDRGNFIAIEDDHTDGKRRVIFDESDEPGKQLVRERYEKFPGYTTIVHKGSVVKDAVAITFDDGPDPDWTPEILDILKAKGVKAAFFMIGANMEKYPDLVRRIDREGHIIGVHTYTHPNIALVSKERAYLEFNVTQRLVEAITGHSTTLFRPPYHADTNPREPEELVPVKLAQAMGYMTVSEDIDPEDWARPGVEAMVERVKTGRRMGGEIILLHDGGGDRGQTVQALSKIIDYLGFRGDTVLSLPEMVGVPKDQLMPAVLKHQQPLTQVISSWGFRVIHTVTDFFWAFMIVATGLVVLRTLIVAFLAIQNRRRDRGVLPEKASGSGPSFLPPVSVLIAAYNEEKVIYETLRALLSTDYQGEIEILVVDDGSTDNTAGIVSAMALEDSRIRLVQQTNGGKAAALKKGFEAVRHEIIISLDADTQFEPGTIGELVKPFTDQRVGAVSGRARVGNPNSMVARFQSLEYTSGFNLDRRAYHELNCITVVPGAVSALRKSAVMAVGGVSADTLAEDTDLTLSLHKGGFKVEYASRAVAWTEAPETVRAFSRQRFRWAFGTLQCLWKHRNMLFDHQFRALGWFSLPSVWFFNIFLVAIGPVIDAILLVSLVLSPAHKSLYLYFGIFLLADLLMAAIACRIEKEPISQIRLVAPMRFVYRPVLSYAVARAIIKAIKGVWVGWGKLDRTAAVTHGRVLTFLVPVSVWFALGLFVMGCERNESVAVPVEGPVEIVMPLQGAYGGAYVDFGEGESHVTYDGLVDFEKMVGKHLAVVAFGNFWGDQAFPLKTVRLISGYGAIPLLFWSPWDKPYEEHKGPDRFSLDEILAGKWDDYIDQWADDARRFEKPLMVSFALEMNGDWFPWGGYFYGGGKLIGEKDGQPLYQGPELVKKAYCYVIDRVKARKADNILWGFHVNHFGFTRQPWNAMINYYPGPDRVDWLGLSVYGKMEKEDGWPSFEDVMDSGYNEICRLDPDKPVIVAEWGVGEYPPGDKAGFITRAFNDMKTKYTRVRAAVYWHERWENKDGSFTNLHVNSSPAALDAYRNSVRDPYWMDRPQFRKRLAP